MWIKDNQLYTTHSEIRQACPNTSFPSSLTDEMIAHSGFFVVKDAPTPSYNALTQRIERTPPDQLDDEWIAGWKIIEIPLAEIEANRVSAFEEAVVTFDKALTAHLDSVAKQRRYDNRITCMVRAGFAGPFQAEGVAFATWCDTCNILAYQMLQKVQAGIEPMPASPKDFISTLPTIVWPE